jgi:DNA-binding NtrC family response regulator
VLDNLFLSLWRGALAHPLQLEAPVFASTPMLVLRNFLESLPSDASLALVGEPGTGRKTLARVFCEAHALDWPLKPKGGPKKKGSIEILTHLPHEKHFDAVLPVPPLRARLTELEVLCEDYVHLIRKVTGRTKLVLSAEVLAAFRAWPWPGNIGELQNTLLRAARMSASDEIGLDSLPKRMLLEAPSKNLRASVQEAEREVLLNMLARTRWNVSVAASRLGLPRRTVVYRMARLGLHRPGKK